jgi:hypothetical protein
MVYFLYDHTAIGKRVEADEYYKIVIKTLRKNKWGVKDIYMGDTPSHYVKYEKIKAILKDTIAGNNLMPIGINRKRCPKLLTSIKFAPAKMVKGKTHKDKSSEQDPKLDQSETTHFSDTYDQLLWGVKVLNLIKMQTSGTGGVQAR